MAIATLSAGKLLAAVTVGALGLGVAYWSAARERAEPEPASPAAVLGGMPASGPEANPAAPTPAPSGVVPPRFDVVRVASDGSAVVAGLAAPGATVTVRVGETELATVEAAPSGEFVAIFRAEPAAEPRALTLGAEMPGGGRAVSAKTVLLLPSAPALPSARPSASETHAPGAAKGEPRIAATAILRPGEAAVAAQPTAAGPQELSLAAISYGADGAVLLEGLGPAGARLRVYVDNRVAADTSVDAGGRWRVALGGIAAGNYRLRVDGLAGDGTVASRVETPFQRDLLRTPRTDPGAPVSVTVQPGDNLWTIARRHFGRGMLYTQIFTANSELIRDPDVIHPGQIFALPESEGAREARRAGPGGRP